MNRPDSATDIREVLDRLVRQDFTEPTATILPPNAINTKPMQPPGVGDTQRDAVAAIVGSMVDELHRKIEGIRQTLDKIEQQALESAARAKGTLNDHIVVCVRLNDEIDHMSGVVAQIHDLVKST